jgi:hypothetical protein
MLAWISSTLGRMICSVNEACSVMWLSPFSLSRQTLAPINPPTALPVDTPIDTPAGSPVDRLQ